MKKYLFPLMMLTVLLPALKGQATYEHMTNRDIYALLDELASEKVISLNAAIKPYTRSYIYKKLIEASAFMNDTVKTQFIESPSGSRLRKELLYCLDYYRFGNEPNTLPEKKLLNVFPKSNHAATSLNHLGYYYSDSLFSFGLRPILGLEYYSNASGDYQHTYGGLEACATTR